ncbi:nucleotide-binding universal stress UspA family protein [Arthrobacter sp. PvP023]|uniref:universal stress protein n=1 Tax=Micrococcaceae TaxID=1268 RepID=UPI001AE9CFC5|nr:universal stress protein [Arthrobacter sp. PvP023]MBP1137347.1 nucleotide-binding universal stress UspA family protein [Arthrobacter sp. PvP023]
MASTGSFLIVVGFDGSEYSQAALDWAMDEARQRNGHLRLVTAWHKPPMAWYPTVLETAAGEIAAEDSPEQVARTRQGEALKSAADGGVTAAGELVDTPSPASAILEAAKDADLIVVGSRGHGGFPGLHLGSVSTQVVTHAQCPVLVVHRKA